MCVALAALEAVVRVTGTKGERSIPFADFHRLPGDTPQIDTNLQADEIITAIELAHDLDYNLWQLRVHLKRLGSWISICPGLRC